MMGPMATGGMGPAGMGMGAVGGGGQVWVLAGAAEQDFKRQRR